MEEKKYWCDPKIYKQTYYIGIFFLFVCPFYGIYTIGLNALKLAIIVTLCGIPAIYFFSISRKYRNKPVLITNSTSITIADPFDKVKIITVDSIKSVNQTSKGLITIQRDENPKTVHINGKALFKEDRESFLVFIHDNIKNS